MSVKCPSCGEMGKPGVVRCAKCNTCLRPRPLALITTLIIVGAAIGFIVQLLRMPRLVSVAPQYGARGQLLLYAGVVQLVVLPGIIWMSIGLRNGKYWAWVAVQIFWGVEIPAFLLVGLILFVPILSVWVAHVIIVVPIWVYIRSQRIREFCSSGKPAEDGRARTPLHTIVRVLAAAGSARFLWFALGVGLLCTIWRLRALGRLLLAGQFSFALDFITGQAAFGLVITFAIDTAIVFAAVTLVARRQSMSTDSVVRRSVLVLCYISAVAFTLIGLRTYSHINALPWVTGGIEIVTGLGGRVIYALGAGLGVYLPLLFIRVNPKRLVATMVCLGVTGSVLLTLNHRGMWGPRGALPEIRIVTLAKVTEGTPGAVMLHDRAFVVGETLADENLIRYARTSPLEPGGLVFRLVPEAEERLNDHASRNVGGNIGFVVAGTLTNAPTVREETKITELFVPLEKGTDSRKVAAHFQQRHPLLDDVAFGLLAAAGVAATVLVLSKKHGLSLVDC